MKITLVQKLILFFIQILLYIVRFLELVTSFDIRKILNKSKLLFGYFGTLTFLLFISYIFYSDSFSYLADGFIYKYFPVTETNLKTNRDLIMYYPVLRNEISIPQMTVKSALVMEKNKSKVLYEFNSLTKFFPASTTKLMTALVSLDLYDLDESVTVSKECTEVEGNKAWILEGFEFKVKDLLYSLLISSAGDSACVLATSKVDYEEFVDLMNQKAKNLGMDNTTFSNPIGLDPDNGEAHFTTAKDLYKLTVVATSKPIIKDIVSTKRYTLMSTDSKFSVDLFNTNKLLWEIPNSQGIKTGTTAGAGEVLIYEYASEGRDLVIIVMGSQDRFYDTRALLSWSLRSYDWGY